MTVTDVQSMPAVREGLFETDPPALLASRCAVCGAMRFPQSTICPDCQSREVATVRLSDHGVVFSFTVVRAAPPGYRGAVPYGLGMVELPDGLRVTSVLTAASLDDLAIGDVVVLDLIVLGDDDERVMTYVFRRREEA